MADWEFFSGVITQTTPLFKYVSKDEKLKSGRKVCAVELHVSVNIRATGMHTVPANTVLQYVVYFYWLLSYDTFGGECIVFI